MPEIIVDDAEVGHLLDNPGFGRVGACLAFARGGILDESLPVPDEPANVELVVEDPDATLPVAIDGRLPPGASSKEKPAAEVRDGLAQLKLVAGVGFEPTTFRL